MRRDKYNLCTTHPTACRDDPDNCSIHPNGHHTHQTYRRDAPKTRRDYPRGRRDDSGGRTIHSPAFFISPLPSRLCQHTVDTRPTPAYLSLVVLTPALTGCSGRLPAGCRSLKRRKRGRRVRRKAVINSGCYRGLLNDYTVLQKRNVWLLIAQTNQKCTR